MTATELQYDFASDPISATVVHCLMRQFLAAAGGDPVRARATVLDLLSGYRIASTPELLVAAEIVGFAAAAADSLRLSMRPDLSPKEVAQHRSCAVALDRSAERSRKSLLAMQQLRTGASERRPPQRAKTSAKRPAPMREAQSRQVQPQIIVHNPAPPDPVPAATHPDVAEHPLARPTIH